jgi:hypothetical protein
MILHAYVTVDMANYLDNLEAYTNAAIEKIAEQRALLRTERAAGRSGQQQINNIVWYNQLLEGSADTNQTEELRLRLLTLLVDNAQLNTNVPVEIINLYQPFLFETAPSGTATSWLWGGGVGNINDQTDLIAKFNTYLLLAGGTMTGNITFGTGLGLTSTGVLNLGTGATQVNIGQAVLTGNAFTTGVWNATAISTTKGGTGLTAIGTALQYLRVNAGATALEWATLPSAPDLSLYVLKAGDTMTGTLNFSTGFGIDSAGSLLIGGTATDVTIGSDLIVGSVVQGAWEADPVALAYGGTQTVLSAPAADAFFFWDQSSAAARFVTLGTNLSYDDATSRIRVTSPITSTTWQGNTIQIAYGGTGLTTLGSALQVLRVNAGGTELEYATISSLTNPMTTLGDIIYGAALGSPTRLAGDTTNTRKFLRSLSTLGTATAPVWDTLVAGDIPTIAQSQVFGLTDALANKLDDTLTEAYIFVGSDANAAVGVPMSGDGSLDKDGVMTIANDAVSFAKMQNVSTAILLGRWGAGSGDIQQITIGSGLSLSGSGVLTSSGGGGTPGGSSGEIQWNNAGAFDGFARMITDGSDLWVTAANFFIADDATSPSSSLVFDISLLTGAVSWIVPDSSDTFVGEATTQALTNKTLTSPVINVGSDATGDIYYRNSGGLFTRLGVGSNGQVLTLASGLPSWANVAGTGDVVGPGSATDNAFTRFDGTTGKLIQNSAATLNDSGVGTFVGLVATGASALTLGTASSIAGAIVFRNGTNANTTTIQSGVASASVTYTLPTADGTSGQVLQTNGSGVLSWVTGGGGGSTALSALTSATGSNTITGNGNFAQEWQWNTLAGATAFRLSSTSTAAASNAQTLFSVGLSGANGTAGQTTTAGSFSNTHTGGTSTNVGLSSTATGGTTNIALSLTASGGTNNYALLVTAGLVGIGLTTPTALMHISGATASIPHAIFVPMSGVTPTLTTNGAMWMNTGSPTNTSLLFYKDSAVTKFITLDRNPDFATGSSSGVVVSDSSGNLTKSSDLTALGIFSVTTPAAAVTNDTDPTSIIGSVTGSTTLPSGFFGVGKTIKVFASGEWGTNSGSNNVDILIIIGGVTVATIPLLHSGSMSSKYWEINATIVCITTGASGTVRAGGSAYFETTSGHDSGFDIPAVPGAINMTSTVSFDVQAEWGSASASNTITATQVYAHYLN